METLENKYIDLTWDIARKLINLTEEQREEIFGYSNVEGIIKNHSANIVGVKIFEYEKKLKEENICIGEVVGCDFIYQGIVVSVDYDLEYKATYHVIRSDGKCDTFDRSELTKTGKKVDILQTLSDLISR